MERVVIVIDGEYAKEKAEAVRQLVTEQVAANGIIGTNVYIEKHLQVMPFMITGKASERGNTYGKQICGSIRNG